MTAYLQLHLSASQAPKTSDIEPIGLPPNLFTFLYFFALLSVTVIYLVTQARYLETINNFSL